MKKILLRFLFFCIAFSSSVKAEEFNDTQTVLSFGIGSTIELAVQNAAENAMTQVVGTFIDSETLIQKRKEISNGVKSTSKTIDTRLNQYSQGSIKKIDILENENENGIFKVTAKVEVRIKDFKAYIKKITSSEVSIGTGLFSQVAIEQKNSQSRESIIVNKVLIPILSGEAAEITIEKPTLLSNSKYYDYIKKNSNLQMHIAVNQSTVLVPFNIKLKDGFYRNMIDIFEQTADKRTMFNATENEVAYIKNSPSKVSLLVEDASPWFKLYEFDSICDQNTVKNSNSKINLNDSTTHKLSLSQFCLTAPIYANQWPNYFPNSYSQLVITAKDNEGKTLLRTSAAANTKSFPIRILQLDNKMIDRVLPQNLSAKLVSGPTYLNFRKVNATPHNAITKITQMLMIVNLPSEQLKQIDSLEIVFE